MKKISTQGIKYAGSKLKLIPHILSICQDLPIETVFDGFSGTTRVSQAFAKSGYKVISSDKSYWSEACGICFLKNKKERLYYSDLIKHLNNIPSKTSWFTNNYGGKDFKGSAVQPDGQKKPWQIHNTKKLDGIREEIDKLKLSTLEKSVALTSLILALDKVDNSLGHYSSYLKNWSARSYKKMELKIPELFKNTKTHKVLRGDVFKVIKNIKADLAYLDPPYGSNNEKMPSSRIRYESYYHVWTSIIKNDRPVLFGKAGRRKDSSDRVSKSVFEDFKDDRAIQAIDSLIELVPTQYVLLSYNSNGIVSIEKLKSLLNKHGNISKIFKIDYKQNVQTQMTWTKAWARDLSKNQEYLFLLEKN